MSVTTLIPPASSSLISLSQVKLYLSITDTSLDTLYTQLIRAASSTMIDFIGVHPGRQRYRETGYGNGSSRRYLSRLPVEAGTLSISLDGEALTEGSDAPEKWTLEEPSTGKVYRQSTWPHTSAGYPPNLIFTYYAGFILPDQISDWTASTAYSLGAWVRPPSSSPSIYRFECTTAGTTGGTAPTFPSTLSGTVTDGEVGSAVVWTARAAQELPPVVSQWCYAEFLRQRSALKSAPGISSWTVEGVSESYFATQTSGVLPAPVMQGLVTFRKKLGVVGVA